MLILSDELIRKYKQNLQTKKKQFNNFWDKKQEILNLLSNIQTLDDNDRKLINENKIYLDLNQLQLGIETTFAEIQILQRLCDLEVRE